MANHNPFVVTPEYLRIEQETRTTYENIVSLTTINQSKRAKAIALHKHHNTIVEPNGSHVYISRSKRYNQCFDIAVSSSEVQAKRVLDVRQGILTR